RLLLASDVPVRDESRQPGTGPNRKKASPEDIRHVLLRPAEEQERNEKVQVRIHVVISLQPRTLKARAPPAGPTSTAATLHLGCHRTGWQRTACSTNFPL